MMFMTELNLYMNLDRKANCLRQLQIPPATRLDPVILTIVKL